jgi:5-methylcytosine-specific restriction endonuclease McrA
LLDIFIFLGGVRDFSKIRSSKRTNGVLSSKVLILNQNFEPISICNTKKAILLLFLGKAELIETKNGKLLHSPSREIPFPSIVRLCVFVHIPYKKIILSRKNIIRRDGHRCQYCGASSGNLTIDHVLPRSLGGEDTWENLVTACVSCNNRKDNQSPEEANLKLLRRPMRPNHITFIKNSLNRIEESWKPYLFLN